MTTQERWAREECDLDVVVKECKWCGEVFNSEENDEGECPYCEVDEWMDEEENGRGDDDS